MFHKKILCFLKFNLQPAIPKGIMKRGKFNKEYNFNIHDVSLTAEEINKIKFQKYHFLVLDTSTFLEKNVQKEEK